MAKHVTSVRQNGQSLASPQVTAYGYDLAGELTRATLPNGVITAYHYTAEGRLDTLTNYGPDDTPENLTNNPLLSAFAYQRDPAGRITHVSESVRRPDGGTTTAAVDYVYDALGRLTHEQRDSSVNTEDYSIDYVLDLASNRRTKTTTKGGTVDRVDSQYDARDRLLEEDGFLDEVAAYSVVYGYDANGSQRTLTRTGTLPETTSYDFDVRNRLAGMDSTRTLANSDVEHLSASYTYNDDGIRVGKTETRSLNAAAPTTTATIYLIDDATPTGYAQAIEEREATVLCKNRSTRVGKWSSAVFIKR